MNRFSYRRQVEFSRIGVHTNVPPLDITVSGYLSSEGDVSSYSGPNFHSQVKAYVFEHLVEIDLNRLSVKGSPNEIDGEVTVSDERVAQFTVRPLVD